MPNGQAQSPEVVLGRHDERISDLEEFKDRHIEDHAELNKLIKRIEIRPSWGVSITITGMSSLIVYLLMKVVGG